MAVTPPRAVIAFRGAIQEAAPLVSFEVPASYGLQPWSFRDPGRSFVWRFFAHLLVRLLVLTPLPPQFQAAAVLFPVSVLWPFVKPVEAVNEGPAETAAEVLLARSFPLSDGLSGVSPWRWDPGLGVRSDIVMSGSTAIIAIGGGKAKLVDLTSPTEPRVTGEISGVGTRLALTESNLLVSTDRTYLTNTILDALRGLHVAALETIAVIRRVTSFVFGVKDGETVSARDVKVRFGTAPEREMSSGQVEVFKDGVLLETLPATVSGTEGIAVWPKDRVVDPRAQYSVEAVVDPGTPDELRSARRALFPVVGDLDVDSDNNDGLENPKRNQAEEQAEDVQGDVTKPGKVVFASDGDTDGDGIPDFADGLDKFGQSAAKASGRFVPMMLELPRGVDLGTAKIQFGYQASDPQALERTGSQESGYTYTLPPGALRIWTKDGPVARKAASVEDGGDFVPAFRDLAVSALGAPLQGRVWKFYVEAVRHSTEVGGAQVKAELTSPVTDEPDVKVSDAVRFTVLSQRLVQADAANNTRPVRDIKFSHPSPLVSVSSAQLSNLRLSDDRTRILGDLEVSGQISCAVCDYTPGDLGTIDSVRVFWKDRTSPVATLPVNGSKANEAPSLLRPFAYTASYSGVIPEVDVSDGSNLLRVEAADKVFGITGYSELNLGVTSTEPAPIVADYRVRLDFAGAHSLAEVTPDRAVHLRVVDKARVPEAVFEGDVFRTAEDPLTFSSADASVVVGQPADLDAALSPTVKGEFDATVSVTSLAAFGFFHRLKETGQTSSVFARDLLHAELTLSGPLSAGVPDTLDAVVDDGVLPALARTLTETGANTRVFTAGDGSLSVTIPAEQPYAPELGVLQFRVTASTLGVSERQAMGVETVPSSGVFATIESTRVESFDRADYTDWTFAAEAPQPGEASTGGEFNPYLLQILGPEEFLAQMDSIETDDGPRRVRRAFDGNYYVFMKNSPPILVIVMPTGPGTMVVDPALVSAQARFLGGYAKGLGLGVVSLVEGVFQLATLAAKEGVRLHPLAVPFVMTFGDRYASELAVARSTKDLAVKLGNLTLAMQQDQTDLSVALLSGDLDEIAVISEPYRMAYEYGTELIQAAAQEVLASPPEKQGELLGRVVFELASLAAVYAKAGQVGKLGFLNRVRELPFFRQNPEAMRALQRIAGLMEEMATTKMCFAAGTKVHTAQGLRNIEDIVAGDQVLSRDPKTGAQGFKAVRQTVVTHPTRLYHVWYRGREARSHGDRAAASSGDADGDGEGDGEPSELVSTGEHPYFVVGREAFTPASELTAGDLLGLADGRTAEVVEIRIEDAAGDAFTTHNFEVEDFHTYFVGPEGLWVHNAGAASCEWVFSVYKRLRGQGKTPEQTFKVLERFFRRKGVPDEIAGRALEEAFKDVFPGVQNVWTTGKFTGKVPAEQPGASGWNAWDHFQKHVRKNREFPPEIDDVITYIKRARGFVQKPDSRILRGIRRAKDGSGVVERIYMDVESGEFAIEVLSGPQTGALKSYFLRPTNPLERRLYFFDELGPAR